MDSSSCAKQTFRSCGADQPKVEDLLPSTVGQLGNQLVRSEFEKVGRDGLGAGSARAGAKSPPSSYCRLTFVISTPASAMDSFRPLFVVGHPRSGTTLLATVLSRHSAIAGTPETHFFNEVQYACAPYLRHGPAAAVDRLLETPLRSAAVQRDDLLARLAGYPRVTMPLLFRCWLEAFAARHGKPLVLEKTPYHIRHILEILGWYPTARIIWILRDGRACIASMKKVDWAGDDVTALSRRWVRNIAYALRAERRCPDRVRARPLRRLDRRAGTHADATARRAWDTIRAGGARSPKAGRNC